MKYGSRFRPSPRGRLAGAVGLLILAGLIGALVFMGRIEPERETPVDRLASRAVPSAAGLLEIAPTRRLIALGLPSSGRAGARVAVDALDSLAFGPGLDAVGVLASADDQAALDRYLASFPEDPSLLPRDSPSTAALEGVYRAVWRINEAVGDDRALRVIALEPPGWPPGAAESPASAVNRWETRARHAAEALEEGLLGREPNARVLLLVDGLDALRAVRVRAVGGGSGTHAPTSLASLLRARYGRQLFTVLVDGPPPGGGASARVIGYGGTSLFDDARRRWSGESRFAPLEGLAYPGRVEVVVVTRPGISAEFQPSDPPLTEMVDAYLYPGVG